MDRIIPVILCGGSGTRLWPLSRKSFPKQFVPLVDNKSLLQLTLERVAGLGQHVYAITAEDHRFMVRETMLDAGFTAGQLQGTIILEPSARNTAATAALAAVQASQAGYGQDLLLLCPSDHHIPDTATFVQTIRSGVAAAQAGAIVTFGVVPTFPSTAYGYIQRGAARADSSQQVAKFIEKPDAQKAQALLLAGDTLWNAGIFLMRVDTALAALKEHAPDILASVEQAMQHKTTDALEGHAAHGAITFERPEKDAFNQCRSQSIDYAVMEPHKDVAVVPFNGQWSDVGSWNAVADLAPADAQDNRVIGQGVTHHARNTFIHAPHRPVVALGTQDLLIVDTPDAVLIAHRNNAEQVKDVVSALEQQQLNQAVMHRKVGRPWGWYDSVDAGPGFQVKRLCVHPGASLSLQKHHHRAEHWVVVRGTAQVTRGTEVFTLQADQSTYIPVGEIHRLHNPGTVDLEIIEVQSGDYLGEDDIVRIEDTYGRIQ